MPLVIKEDAGHFEPAPPGLHSAVCCDVVDLGMVDGKFGPKRKLRLVFQTEARNRKGERFQVRASYTQSMYKEANLRKALESWRGRAFTDEETKNFDVEERVLGKNCQLALTHGTSQQGRTFAKITAILPPLKGKTLTPDNYEREPWPTATPAPVAPPTSEVYDVDPIDEGHAAQYDDDSVPF